MTQKTNVPSVCLQPTTTSISSAISGLGYGVVASGELNNIIFCQFDRGQDIPLPEGYVDIDAFVAGFENNPEQRETIEEARRVIARELYSEAPRTLAVLRLEKGWSQARLASEMGTSQSHIARIESGRDDFRLSTLRKLAEKLEVPLDIVIHAIESTVNAA